jgi:hypothetical protein
MRYALLIVAWMLVFSVGKADESGSLEAESTAVTSNESDYSKEELLDAKRSRERKLEEIRSEVLRRQGVLNGSRSALDSDHRRELKAALAEKKQEFAIALKQPVSYWIEQSKIDRKLEEEQAAKAIEDAKLARERAAIAAKADAERVAVRGPLVIEAAGLRPNLINVPALTLIVANRSQQAVVAYTISVECRDRFGDEAVEIKRDNIYRGISQSTVPAGQTERGTWNLNLHRNATKVKVWFSRAKFADGTEWQQSDAEAIENRRYASVDME